MRYPIAIEPGSDQHAFGVVVPDLPGCFSAGDTVEEAIANSEDAILLWLEDAFESKHKIPDTRPIQEHWANSDLEGWIWALVNVDPAKVMGPAERVNISVPTRALAQIDIAASKAGESRSSFLVTSAHKQLRYLPNAEMSSVSKIKPRATPKSIAKPRTGQPRTGLGGQSVSSKQSKSQPKSAAIAKLRAASKAKRTTR